MTADATNAEAEIETSENQLTIRRTFDAPQERVFRAFAEAEELEKRFAPSPDDVSTEVQTFTAEPDGERSIRFHTDDEWFGSDGAFEEVIENERIVYTDRWVNFPEAEIGSRVTVEFSDAEDGTRDRPHPRATPERRCRRGRRDGLGETPRQPGGGTCRAMTKIETTGTSLTIPRTIEVSPESAQVPRRGST
jgi:uncharacterized protein YndB with AHSA1/START domain